MAFGSVILNTIGMKGVGRSCGMFLLSAFFLILKTADSLPWIVGDFFVPERVVLVDWNNKTNTFLFRGNAPLTQIEGCDPRYCTSTACMQQEFDMAGLHTAFSREVFAKNAPELPEEFELLDIRFAPW